MRPKPPTPQEGALRHLPNELASGNPAGAQAYGHALRAATGPSRVGDDDRAHVHSVAARPRERRSRDRRFLFSPDGPQRGGKRGKSVVANQKTPNGIARPLGAETEREARVSTGAWQ